jgi:hypothetical protein
MLKFLNRLQSPNTPRTRKAILGSAGAGIFALLGFHFLMTGLHLQPDNPFRDEVFPLVDAYMAPYFTQNWRLFAPTPEEPSKHIAVVCRFAGPGLEDSPVIDVTAPHYEAMHKYRLSSSQRIVRGQVYPLTLVHPPKNTAIEAMAKLANSDEPGDRELAATLEAAQLDNQQRGMRVLGRVASAECQRRYPDLPISEVELLYFHEGAPKFSQRNDPDARGESVKLNYGWLPYEAVASY